MARTSNFIRLPLLLIIGLLSFSFVSAKTAHVSLHASWNATSSAAEAVVHLLETSGREAAAAMLSEFSMARGWMEPSESDSKDGQSLSEMEERGLVYQAVIPHLANSVSLSTLKWVLSARVHSPRIRLHYGLSERARTVLSIPPSHSIFATVATASDETKVHVITDPSELSSPQSSGSPTVTLSPSLRTQTGDYIPFTNCDDPKVQPSVMLYAHPAHQDLASWIEAVSGVGKRCVGIRFAAPETPYAAPRSKPPLQAFVAHATLRSTEYKVVDDRVFETRLFPDCPLGVEESLCESREIVDSNSDPYVWQSPEAGDKDDFRQTPLQASLFIAEHARKKNANDGLAALLDSLRLYVEDAPGVTRSTVFRNALSNWWTGDEEKAAFKLVRRVRNAVGERSFVMLNGFLLDIEGMRQGVDPLLQCLSTISTASHHLSAVNEGVRILPPRAAPGASENNARVRVLLPVETSGSNIEDEDKSGDDSPPPAVWLNDMYGDSRYKKWPSLQFNESETVSKFVKEVRRQAERDLSASVLHLRLVKLRAHIVTMVLVIDPADLDHLSYLSIPETIVRGDLPIRVALVLVPNSRSSKLIAATFHHLLRVNGRKTAVQFLSMLTQVVQYFGSTLRGAAALPENMINLGLQQLSTSSPYDSVADILEFDQEAQKSLNASQKFAEDLGLFSDIDPEDQEPDEDDDEEEGQDKEEEKSAPAEKVTKKVSMLCVLNGVVIKDLARDLINLAVKEQQRIADLFESNAFPESTNAQELHSDEYISRDASLIVVRQLSKDMREGSARSSSHSKKNKITHMAAKDVVSVISDLRSVSYIDNGVNQKDYKVTVWLAGSSQESEKFDQMRSLLNDAAKSEFAVQTSCRFAVVDESSALHATILSTAADVALGDEDLPENDEHVVFVINGRVLFGSPSLSTDSLFVEIASEFQAADIPSNLKGDMRLLYLLHGREVTGACKKETREVETHLSQETVIKAVSENSVSPFFQPSPNWAGLFGGDSEVKEKSLNVLSVVDPTDRNAFIIVSLLRELRAAYSAKDMSMGLAVIPSADKAKSGFDAPKTYYRYALSSDDIPDDESSESKDGYQNEDRFATRVSFSRMPHDMVMTLAVEAPRAWFVSSYVTNYDMDNVILSQVNGSSDLFSEYELKNLIVEGSCIDEKERPPQGLKLLLSNGLGVTVDTLVMANLGYFQLKVPNPGMWWLSLARGASSRIFSLRAMEMYKDGTRSVFEADPDGRVPVPVQTLSGAGGILLKVAHKPGMEGQSVLKQKKEDGKDEESEKGEKSEEQNQTNENVMGKLKATISKFISGEPSSKDSAEGTDSENEDEDEEDVGDSETINVFSVASGHLYERFLKIMISSVTKHASRKVKFWLLENYLSPAFKKALPEFAREHGATVGMVTYRWPGWLRAQTEKQRIIWAYKILFLDVLFPLNVGRIIFVDSDQVIRGDLAELMDIDLKGAPYGYVPFCDSRKEVEGYRFWKTGFWKETLRGQKYRISALYVVDLKRFRETAAGDTLRYIYQSLSADPNSLSNLDQDLPNYASVNSITGSAVPIFNLPQEWLWCESWCDDESKTQAKAIDLCNNPMTKEPKLVSAKRIISEWVDLDNNASALTEVIYKRLAGQPVPPASAPSSPEDDGSTKTEL